MRILEIKSKRNPDWYNLKIEGVDPEILPKNPTAKSKHITEYLEVHIDDLNLFGLNKGHEISSDDLYNIIKASLKRKLWEKSLSKLSRSSKSTREIRTQLRQYASQNFRNAVESTIIEQYIEETLEKLQNHKFLNDKEFGGNLLSKRLLQRKPLGNRAIISELKQKGISNENIEELTSGGLLENEQERAKELLETLIQKGFDLKNPQHRKKIISRLASRGFSFDTILPLASREDNYKV